MTNLVYHDLSGVLYVGDTRVQIPRDIVEMLLNDGVCFFHITASNKMVYVSGLDQKELVAKKKKPRGRVGPARVLRVKMVAPDGSEEEADNLLEQCREIFGKEHKKAYWSFTRGKSYQGWTVVRISNLRMRYEHRSDD